MKPASELFRKPVCQEALQGISLPEKKWEELRVVLARFDGYTPFRYQRGV